MAVVAGILKLVGFLVLAVLGILLLHVILLLLVPFRYQAEGSFQGLKGNGNAVIRWMLGYLRAEAAVSEEGRLDIYCSLLGIKVWSYGKQLPFPGRNTDTGAQETSTSETPEKAAARARIRTQGTESTADAGNTDKTYSTDNNDSTASTESTANVDNAAKAGLDETKQKLEEAGQDLKETKSKLDALLEQLKVYRDFFCSPQHRETFSYIWERLKNVLEEMRPRQGSGELVFGLGDPYATGQLLEVLAFLFPFYGGWLDVVPIFDEKRFSAKLAVKGRIRLWVLTITALQLYFSKDVKKLITEFREVTKHG